MFGRGDDKKKDDEKKKAEEDQKKPEEEAAGGTADEGKPADDGGGLGGLKDVGSETAEEEKAEEKPVEENPGEKKDEKADDSKELPAEEPEPEEKAAETEVAETDISVKPAEEPAAGKKQSKSELEKLKKQLATQRETMRELEREKAVALKKGDELAGLVEDLSTEMKEAAPANAPGAQPAQPAQAALPDFEPKLKEMEEKTASQIKALQETIEGMGKKKEEDKKGEEEVAVTMKKMFDKRLKELTEKLDDTKAKPAPGVAGTAEPGKGEASGSLMAMGGGVEIKKDVDDMKKTIKDLATLVDAFKEEAENRFMALDRELEVLDRFPRLEQSMEQFEKKLNPENVQRLRMLISTADDLKEEVIPLVVKREAEQKIEPFSKRVGKVEEVNEKVKDKLAELLLDMKNDKKDIKTIYKFEERIAKLEDTGKQVMQLISELRTAMRDLDKNQRHDIFEKMKETFPGVVEAESSNIRKDFAGRFAFVEDKIQSAENNISEIHNEIAELSTLKGEVDTAEDKIEALGEGDKKLGDRIDALKEKHHDVLDMIEKLKTPKEVITELDNKTKDILEIREFFVRRADGLDERIKQLDERAVPTKKLHDKVDALANNNTELRDNQKKLEAKFDSEKKELQKIITQHAAEKKQLEEKLKEQKSRIGYLLKEFK